MNKVIYVVTKDEDTCSGLFVSLFETEADAIEFLNKEAKHYRNMMRDKDHMSIGDGESWGTTFHISEIIL